MRRVPWPALRIAPCGAGLGILIALAVHLLAAYLLIPDPVAREEIRHRVLALTQSARPRLIVAGDSRAAWHVHPLILGERLGLPPAEVVNIGAVNCGSTPVLAAFREFRDRFADQPLLLLIVSVWSVNDRAPTYLASDELLWSVNFVDRLRLVSPVEAVTASFSPERRIVQRLVPWPGSPALELGERGFTGPPERRGDSLTGPAADRQARLLEREWYAPSDLAGVRWRALERDVERLLDLEARVVLVEGPEHPAWRRRLDGTPFGATDDLFHEKLAALARRLAIPLLRYESDWCSEPEANQFFHDFVHLNRRGAMALSRRIGDDLVALLAAADGPIGESFIVVDGIIKNEPGESRGIAGTTDRAAKAPHLP
jgi:hypothetical protein